ncbi:MAG: serine hydrolase [Pseudomonadales bacterium]|nr:serine hydrolase [Pseudomonadales bacterium]
MEVNVSGTNESRFDKVRTAFENLWSDIEVGAALCVYEHGVPVIDLWGGFHDQDMSMPWQANSLVNVYSSTKGMAAIAIAILVDEQKLDYDAPVANYWPEFAQAGKADVTIAQLLSHQAGLCGVDTKLEVEDLYDWGKMIRLLEQQTPMWPLGSGAGYHAVTWGYFPGELVRRVTGMTLGQFFNERVAKPLQADCFIGLSESEFSRCASLIGPNRARKTSVDPTQLAADTPSVQVAKPKMTALYAASLLNPSISPFKHACSDAWRKAEIAASNGHASARGISKIYAAMALGGELDGTKILSQAAIEQANKIEVEGIEDKVLGGKIRRSRGFILNTDHAYGPNLEAFGHAGAGGSLGFADPVTGIGFAYVMNQMQSDSSQIPRSQRLVNALYDCISNK